MKNEIYIWDECSPNIYHDPKEHKILIDKRNEELKKMMNAHRKKMYKHVIICMPRLK